MSVSSPEAEGVGADRVSFVLDDEEPPLFDTSSVTGLGRPENSSRTMPAAVPDESFRVVTEKLAVLTPAQLESANQP